MQIFAQFHFPHYEILQLSSHYDHRGSLRDQIGGSNGGSETQIHTIRSSQSGALGPIRTKHQKDSSTYGSDRQRKDSSPYGSERLSIPNETGGSNSHLSPPDLGAWRRVRSDPFLATSVSGSSTGVSPAGSITDTPTAVQDSNGAISPLHGASPTMHRRVPYNSGSHIPQATSNVQNVKNNHQLGIPVPATSSGGKFEIRPICLRLLQHLCNLHFCVKHIINHLLN